MVPHAMSQQVHIWFDSLVVAPNLQPSRQRSSSLDNMAAPAEVTVSIGYCGALCLQARSVLLRVFCIICCSNTRCPATLCPVPRVQAHEATTLSSWRLSVPFARRCPQPRSTASSVAAATLRSTSTATWRTPRRAAALSPTTPSWRRRSPLSRPPAPCPRTGARLKLGLCGSRKRI